MRIAFVAKEVSQTWQAASVLRTQRRPAGSSIRRASASSSARRSLRSLARSWPFAI